MTVTIALVGLLVLVGLAVAVGVVDTRPQQLAWNRIAAARRDLHLAQRDLGEYSLALDVREEQLAVRERRLIIGEQLLEHRAQALDLREQALAAREREAPTGPDAA